MHSIGCVYIYSSEAMTCIIVESCTGVDTLRADTGRKTEIFPLQILLALLDHSMRKAAATPGPSSQHLMQLAKRLVTRAAKMMESEWG